MTRPSSLALTIPHVLMMFCTKPYLDFNNPSMQFANKKHFRVPTKNNTGLYLLAQNLYRLQAFKFGLQRN